MSIWNADLTTRMGAESAADNGGLACFFYAGFELLALLFALGVLGMSFDGMIYAAGAAFGITLCVIAGIRMRAGKGAFLGMAVAAMMVLAVGVSILNGAMSVGIIITAVIFVVLVQGIRGSLALRQGQFPDEDFEVFE